MGDTYLLFNEPFVNLEHEEVNHRHFLAGWRFHAMIITVILSVIGYLLFTLWGGWNEVVESVARVGAFGIGIALLLSLINYGLRFMRWQMFLEVLGHKIPLLPSLKIYISGFALTTTPGKAGEALRSVFLKDYGMGYRQSFGAFFAERLSDLIAVVILASLGLWIYPEARIIIIAVIAIICFVIFALQREPWLRWCERFGKRILPSRFGHIVEFILETMLAFRCCYSPRVLIYGIVLGVIAWGAEGFALYYLLQLLGTDVSMLTAQFIYGFSLLIGAITFLPGGLGGAEVTMLKLLMLNSVPTSLAVAITIVIRLATLWFSVVLGLIALPKQQIKLHP